MVHGVRIADGEAKWYRNRYVRSDAVARSWGSRRAHAVWDNTDFAANTHVSSTPGRRWPWSRPARRRTS